MIRIAESIYDEYLYPFVLDQIRVINDMDINDFKAKLEEGEKTWGEVSKGLLVDVADNRISDYHTIYPFCPNTIHHYIKDLLGRI